METNGLIVKAQSGFFTVKTGSGLVVCQLRGKLKQGRPTGDLAAIGDKVRVTVLEDGTGVIEEVGERKRAIVRLDPRPIGEYQQVLLANADQAVFVFACAHPKPKLRMLDRFLVIAESNELPAIICVNKIDLTGLDGAKSIFGEYEKLGYPMLYASVTEGRGLDELHALLEDRLTVVSGPSGVGKSALINALHPGLNLRVGEVRDFEGKGQHTTRGAHLIRLPFGKETFIADTPGIRELGLYEIDPGSLAFYFVEMKPFIHDCRFPNCTHTHEPECAVRAAVARGEIAAERYESYLRVLDGEDLQLDEW